MGSGGCACIFMEFREVGESSIDLLKDRMRGHMFNDLRLES